MSVLLNNNDRPLTFPTGWCCISRRTLGELLFAFPWLARQVQAVLLKGGNSLCHPQVPGSQSLQLLQGCLAALRVVIWNKGIAWRLGLIVFSNQGASA
ncbi:hypothetical protein MESS2_1600009 [Mesorhizobium metallidurans STM 2683]|uniref:Uncharacterized protein n=1 Tax=Mesorhizobium metallidurans STM 2683 TaxID=1297569 RepID=M5EMP6_9HYPH|nr:hypothetical protein MESS2_1600009 [Mesorhizobium metallidurans STM 2683]